MPYLLLIPAAITTGAVFLSLGQAMAGLLTSATLVSAACRVVFLVLYVTGFLGLTGGLGTRFKTIAQWSPVGSTADLFRTALVHAGWTTADTHAVLVATRALGQVSDLSPVSWRAAARTFIVPPGPCPPPADTPHALPVVTTSQVKDSLHDFAVPLATVWTSRQ